MWTNEEKFECAHRELVIRIRVYARQVAQKKMTEQEAGREIALMSAIAEDYRKLIEHKNQLTFFENAIADKISHPDTADINR